VDILHLIDRLEELVADARRMPIGQGVVIDRRRVLELVDQMRSTVPWEVREAREIVAERDVFLEESRRQSEGIIHRAELEAESKLNDTVVVRQAEHEASLLISRAEERSQRMLEEAQEQVMARIRQAEQAATNQMDEADRYALEMLRRLDQQLAAFSTTVRAGIDALEERTNPAPSSSIDDYATSPAE
jgi:hypothetical protein